jgi:hypothetical protein
MTKVVGQGLTPSPTLPNTASSLISGLEDDAPWCGTRRRAGSLLTTC